MSTSIEYATYEYAAYECAGTAALRRKKHNHKHTAPCRADQLLRLVGNLAHDEETSACAAASSRSSCLRFVGNRRSAPVLSCLTSGLFSLTPNSCGALICAFRRTARHTCACFTKQADAWRHAAVHTHEAPARLPAIDCAPLQGPGWRCRALFCPWTPASI